VSVRDVIHLSVRNWFANFTLSADATVETAYPLTNMQNQNADEPAVIDMTAETSVIIQGTGSTEYVANCFSLFNHNIPADATVRLQLYPEAAYAGTAYDSTALPAQNAIPWGAFMASDEWGDTFDNVSNLKSVFAHLFTAFRFKSFKITIAGGTWENDAISIDKGWLGAGYAFDMGAVHGTAMTIVDKSSHQPKPFGGMETREGACYRSLKIEFEGMSETEALLVSNMLDRIKKGGDFFCTCDPNNTRGQLFRQSGIFRRDNDLSFIPAYYNGNAFGLAATEN
jgi:hypothetical protein